jgi:hypothetical protein
MLETHDFLARLGLDDSADARAIRRAYARELKLIDQGREAARFQALRDAYETALSWADYQARRRAAAKQDGAVDNADGTLDHADGTLGNADGRTVASTIVHDDAAGATRSPVTTTSAAVARFDLVDPQRLASRAFDALLTACAALTQGRMLHDVALWQDALRRQLDHDDLLNMSARMLFEGRVAQLLAGGWKTGHETLFAAASEVFQWTRDQRRLQQFAYPGALLNAAVEERRLFEAQAAPERDTGQRILARLRKGSDPDPEQLQRDMFYLQRMLARFPSFMKVSASADVVTRWQALYVPVADVRRGHAFVVDGARPGGTPALGGHASFATKCICALALIIVLVFALNWSVDPPHAERPATPRAPHLSSAQRAWPTVPSLIAPTPDYAPLLTKLTKLDNKRDNKSPALVQRRDLTRAQLDAIGKHIRYLPLPGAPPGERRVDVDVKLDLDGNVSSIETKKPSIDPDYDAAVAAAIRTSQRYPAATPRHFAMWFSVTLRPRAAPPERAE